MEDNHYKNGGKGRSKSQKRKLLFKQQHGKCAICGRQMALNQNKLDPSTLDHVLPRSKGGTRAMTNLRLAHATCNNSRGNNTDDVFVTIGGVKALRWNIKQI